MIISLVRLTYIGLNHLIQGRPGRFQDALDILDHLVCFLGDGGLDRKIFAIAAAGYLA